MIGAFVESWHLFGLTYTAGWLLAVLLAMAGVLVVARRQVFIGAAVTQASTLGVATCVWAAAVMGEAWLNRTPILATAAVLFAVIASLLTVRTESDGGREDMAAWVFLASLSVTILLMMRAPIGMSEIQAYMASTLIGATRWEVITFGLMVLVTAIIIARLSRALILLAMDPQMAAATGLDVLRWELAQAASLGLIVGLAIRVGGMLYCFGMLVLPAMIAARLCRRARTMFLAAPLVALGTAMTAFVLANYYDLPPAAATIALLTAIWLALWVLHLVSNRMILRRVQK